MFRIGIRSCLKVNENIISLKYLEKINFRNLSDLKKSGNEHGISPVVKFSRIDDDLRQQNVFLTKIKSKSKHFFWHSIDSFIFVHYGCLLFKQDYLRYMTILKSRFITRKPFDFYDKLHVIDFNMQMLKFIPFIILVIAPGGEFILIPAVKFFPKTLPSQFDVFGQNLDVATSKKLSEFIINLDASISERLDGDGNDYSLTALLNHRNDQQFIDKFKVQSIKTVVEILSKFDESTFLEIISIKTLRYSCNKMNINSECSREVMSLRIFEKVQNLRSDDFSLFSSMERNFDDYSDEYLHAKCQARGIKCYGTTRPTIVKRLKRWLQYSSDSFPIPYIIMFITKIYNFDQNDSFKALLEEKFEFDKKIMRIMDWNPKVIKDRKWKLVHQVLMDFFRISGILPAEEEVDSTSTFEKVKSILINKSFKYNN